MTDRMTALDQYVEQHVQESMQELARLCNQPSISSQGLGMRECAALVAELLRSHGIAAQVMQTAGYPVVYGEYGTGEQTLLLYNHYDVQPPDPLDQWDSPPFAAVQCDGKFFARGAADDKGVLISRLAAFDAARATCDHALDWAGQLLQPMICFHPTVASFRSHRPPATVPQFSHWRLGILLYP